MTFSILVQDAETGAIGGAAATGSLCVGGWVLRGDIDAGMSASQGAAPSTFWGEDVLRAMRNGASATEAVTRVTAPDSGREWRQLATLDLAGGTGAFTGKHNEPARGSHVFSGGIAAGNVLSGPSVLSAMAEAFAGASGSIAERLMAALDAAETSGGDSRGLMSAALLVLRRDAPPLNLRIDHAAAPLPALRALHARTTSGDYHDWTTQVPCPDAPERRLRD